MSKLRTTVQFLFLSALFHFGCAPFEPSLNELHQPVPSKSLSSHEAPQALGKIQKPLLRRLNSREVLASLQDLLTEQIQIESDLLPKDFNNSLGFDTDGQSLSLSPADAELYLTAFTKVVDQVFSASALTVLDCEGMKMPAHTIAKNCLSAFLKQFLERAHRRKISKVDLESYLQLASSETDLTEGLKSAVVAALLSPRFLYHGSRDLQAISQTGSAVDGFQFAERLSFFLWSSVPDVELMTLEEQGSLRSSEILTQQVQRMIHDQRFERFLNGFVEHWLNIDQLKHTLRSSDFPEFNNELASDMLKETKLFMLSLIRENRPVEEALTSSSSFLNQRLAKLYGVQGPRDPTVFEKTLLRGHERKGLLGHAAVLTANGNEIKTQVIKRGHMVVDKILCLSPGAPPADFSGLIGEDLSVIQTVNLRRNNQTCAACHVHMDPVGLGLESYDPIGRFRTSYGEMESVVANDSLFGEPFDGPLQLADTIVRSGRFPACAAKHLLSYGIGTVVSSQKAHLLASTQMRWQDLILNVVSSDSFGSQFGGTQ